MKNYKAMKAANKWAVAKTGSSLFLVKKVYDKDTGATGDDQIISFTLNGVADKIASIKSQILSLTTEQSDWEQLEIDLKAL
tara:strand:- start:336 stop:578 length:243 start_codon:yes stop_codon:yes gene_type:complete